MHQQTQCSLTRFHSFGLPAITPKLYQITQIEELSLLSNLSLEQVYFLGEGTNTLFVEETAPIIVQPAIKGINIVENDNEYVVTAACGENWHQLVTYLLESGINGLENLALIPGSVGAAPVQNIGAYGVELSDVLYSVSWYEFATNTIKEIDNAACKFGYRDSIFKHELSGKGLIIGVTLTLAKNWQATTSYAGLNELSIDATAKDIYDKVIEIRQQKLPDPHVIPNAGSFFKNPIVSNAQLQQLSERYIDIPHYRVDSQHVKLPAGWLIEHAGFKGTSYGNAGVHDKQALVLVNRGGATGQEVIALAKNILISVHQKFNIMLEQEVRTVTQHGYQKIEVSCG